MNDRRTKLLPKIILGQLLVGLVMAGLGLSILFFAEGYRLNLKTFKLSKTGMVSVSTYPYDSKVYLDDEYVHVGTLLDRSPYSTNLTPGYYNVRVERTGFQTWEHSFRIESEMVTKFDSVVLFRSDIQPVALTDERKIDYLNSPSDILANKEKNDALVYSGSEIWLSDKLVTRFSSPVLGASWYPDKEHIVFQLGDQIRLMDRDGSNNILLVKLDLGIPTIFAINNKGDELYYLNNGKYMQATIR